VLISDLKFEIGDFGFEIQLIDLKILLSIAETRIKKKSKICNRKSTIFYHGYQT
jgi:hypothetical protein